MSNVIGSGNAEVNVTEVRSIGRIRYDSKCHQGSDFTQDFYRYKQS